uniref:Universal stress protein n=1 Tax=Desulfomonile tiedjei TaxID=2358 RepID=A0A7C4ET55_9BACT
MSLMLRQYKKASNMFDRLLVAVDGSEASFHALRESLRLAQGGAASVKVISAIPPYEGELRLVGVRNLAATMRGPYEEALARSEEMGRNVGVRVTTLLAQGEAHEVIPEAAQAEGCDVIIVGVRGFNPVESVLQSSVTARIIGASQTNVLVVPLHSSIGLTRLLVAVDGSELGKSALEAALGIRESYGSHISVLSVADVPPDLYGVDAKAARELIEKARIVLQESAATATARGEDEFKLALREGDPAKVINDFARSEKIDLILIGSHGRTGIKKFLLGSVTERVISHAPCPVLVTRA